MTTTHKFPHLEVAETGRIGGEQVLAAHNKAGQPRVDCLQPLDHNDGLEKGAHSFVSGERGPVVKGPAGQQQVLKVNSTVLELF